MGALDQVYQGVIAAHRQAAADVEDSDPVSNDMLIGHLHSLELFHWFVRAHLESPSGTLTDAGAATAKQAANNRVATRTGARRKS